MPFDIKALNSQLPHSQYDSKEKNGSSSSLPSKGTQSPSKENKGNVNVQLDNRGSKAPQNQKDVRVTPQKMVNTPLP